MNTHLRRAAVAVVALSTAVTLAACGKAKQAGDNGDKKEKKGSLTIGLLLPENQTARYERFDKPLLEKKIKELAGTSATVLYENAKQDASVQQQQVDTMITKRVDALIVDAVDAKSIASSVKKAHDKGIPVVAYDRLAEGPVDAYTSVDNERVGKIQGESLLKELGDNAGKGQIVMMNGSVTDPNAKMYKDGAHSVLDGKVKVGKEYDTKEWKPENANENMKGAISSLGKENIVGVYSANDGMAGGIITALKSAGFGKLPPVTGQDAELSAVQRILAGEQFMSVYKPYVPETEAAATMAVALAQGKKLDGTAKTTVDSGSEKKIPAIIVDPFALTKADIPKYVGKEGFFTLREICTDKYKSACDAAGLK
ncbi:substrate-binding domain-containing protein [Streptomyces mobaraensis NBRC 13819 = DSM 40847]|uniref:ABC transporter solute-binding protein n=1 Tax=Streptomyces mobaraensis (strain ATCC 29032 / DSM 40847 / JCM 4168 / NBRC 13819 / NCIMB 11159 / IPCR 16-22) TaxID=1223523 RepID=M3AZJ5_STRM1|nr:substrate-binding domain-containing protein [Streptomyces mobaraensis]EME99097.1 ABC transporter solute-binding protein [Streptomyces mobaraensis NBRC 13819 = DSM 40847]QTT76192.1 substrate-binding domain-containing protein [Streptomyces mobaraensis NBRC 13819 = DSM 40847]